MWECLGDAYMNRGSYNAALKAFTKATQVCELVLIVLVDVEFYIIA